MNPKEFKAYLESQSKYLEKQRKKEHIVTILGLIFIAGLLLFAYCVLP